jgi:DNA repair exonuclease SbcCD ATPase subunit
VFKKELEEVISKLKIDLIQDLKAEFELIVETKTRALREEVSQLRDEVKFLRDCVKTANEANNDLEQYGRRMMLDISGIPGDTGDAYENVERKILEYANKIDLNLNENDIDKVHRLGKWRSDVKVNRRVIVKFTNSKARQRLYNARKSLSSGIFEQDSLTRRREQIGYEARKLKREGKLLKTWVACANIYGTMKKFDHEIKVHIKNMDSIEKIRAGEEPGIYTPTYPYKNTKLSSIHVAVFIYIVMS